MTKQLNAIEVLFSKALIGWYISHDEFLLLNNLLKECDGMKEEIENKKTLSPHQRF